MDFLRYKMFGNSIKRVVCCCFFGMTIFCGCSSLESARYFALAKNNRQISEVQRKDWIFEDRWPCVGAQKPSVSQCILEGNVQLLIYPIPIDRVNFDGPAFLPLIPYPSFLNTKKKPKLLRLVLVGSSQDISIETIDDEVVDQEKMERTASLGETEFSLLLEAKQLNSERLTVELRFQGKKQVLIFFSERYTSFIPFFIP